MEKVLSSPAVGKYLADKATEEDIWHVLSKEGAKGSYVTPTGVIVDYEYDPNSRKVNARLRVDWLAEKAAMEEAAELRKQERKGKVLDGINGGIAKITPYLDTELRARGLDVYSDDPDMARKIKYVIQTEFPKYKTTERSIV